MNYEIPDEEKANVLSIYWMMLRDLESQISPDSLVCDKNLVEGAYNVLNRIGASDHRPHWESKDNPK